MCMWGEEIKCNIIIELIEEMKLFLLQECTLKHKYYRHFTWTRVGDIDGLEEPAN